MFWFFFPLSGLLSPYGYSHFTALLFLGFYLFWNFSVLHWLFLAIEVSKKSYVILRLRKTFT